MRRGEAISEDYARDEAALDAVAVFNSDVASLDEGGFFNVALGVCCGAAAEERDEGLEVSLSIDLG